METKRSLNLLPGVGLVFCVEVSSKWKSIFLINTCSLKGLKVSFNTEQNSDLSALHKTFSSKILVSL